jgi:hypothetical protein
MSPLVSLLICSFSGLDYQNELLKLCQMLSCLLNSNHYREYCSMFCLKVLSEILAARVCGGSKIVKKKIIRKMRDLLINAHVWFQSLL